MTYALRTIIIPASIAPTCRQMAVSVAESAGAGMWVKGLSASGNTPATHYVSSGAVGDDMVAYLTDADALSAAAGIPLAQAQALVSAATVVDLAEEAPFDTFARLGLKLVQADE